jgi:hypothetical protein
MVEVAQAVSTAELTPAVVVLKIKSRNNVGVALALL